MTSKELILHHLSPRVDKYIYMVSKGNMKKHRKIVSIHIVGNNGENLLNVNKNVADLLSLELTDDFDVIIGGKNISEIRERLQNMLSRALETQIYVVRL
jgi:hypothetical protein